MNTTILKEIAEISSGQGAPQGNKYFGSEGAPFIRAGSLDFLQAGGNEDYLKKINDETAKKFKLRLYQKGTIIFAKSGMSATKDRVYVLKTPCYIVSHLAAIVPEKEEYSQFLKYWFRQFRPSQLIKDKSYPSIRLTDIEEIKIPNIPDSTKYKVVSILEKCESAIEKRKEANRLTNEFLKSTFLEMFGDPIKNPKNWEADKIDNVIEKITNENPEMFPDKIYDYIDISSIANNLKTIAQVKNLKGSMAPSRARQIVISGDILVSTVRPNLNAVAIVPDNLNNPIASTGFCVLRSDRNLIRKEYLFEICKMSYFINSLTKIAKGASYPAVSDSDVRNIVIPMPPLSEQRKFADIVQKVEKLKEKQKESEKELNNLFNSLMQKSFKGELFQ